MNRLIKNPHLICRRKFLRTMTAASSFVFIAPSVNAAQSAILNNEKTLLSLQQIEESIHVNFGSMFNVISFKQDQSEVVTARIEHLENQFSVISDDLNQWNVVSSTEI